MQGSRIMRTLEKDRCTRFFRHETRW